MGLRWSEKKSSQVSLEQCKRWSMSNVQWYGRCTHYKSRFAIDVLVHGCEQG